MNKRVVLDVYRCHLVVVLQIGTNRRSLVAFSGKPAEGDGVFVVDLVVEFDDAVVAVAVLRVRAEEIVGCRSTLQGTVGPQGLEHGGGDRILLHSVKLNDTKSCLLVGRRRLGGQSLSADCK